MKKNIAIISIIAVAIIGFIGGYEYSKSQVPAPLANRRGVGTGSFGGGRLGGVTNGTVIAKDDKSVTVQLQGTTGGSKIVFTSAMTTVMKSVSGTLSDVVIGDTIIANGTPNADGSINAQSIQIRPAAPVGQAPGATPAQ